MKNFMDRDFLLETETAKKLYHDYAEQMPIIDYHCHIPAEDIAPVIRAIGNHDEVFGVPVSDLAAALIIADKSDV